jgi:hypothetical protein
MVHTGRLELAVRTSRHASGWANLDRYQRRILLDCVAWVHRAAVLLERQLIKPSKHAINDDLQGS